MIRDTPHAMRKFGDFLDIGLPQEEDLATLTLEGSNL